MDDRGYTDRPVKTLSIADLLREALQAGHSAGFYAGVLERGGTWSEYEPLLIKARDRRNACFNELQQRLEVAAQTARALQNIYDGINDEYHPCFREDLLTDQDRTLLVQARAALEAWKEATE
jgi:hypothetical protein